MNLFRKYLVMGLIVLFIGASVLPNISGNSTTYFKPMILGNWLYVGGSGEGNYTWIQDAVDNASPGDTIYVYSGIYEENLFIETNSLSLIGEDKEATIIIGNGNKHTILVELTKDVSITGFSITTESEESVYGGIFISNSKNTLIQNNIIFENGQGINCKDSISFNISNNKIFNNTKYKSQFNTVGIQVVGGNGGVIRKNHIYENLGGILLQEVLSIIPMVMIECNNITNNNGTGIMCILSSGMMIQNNYISNNQKGVTIMDCQNSFLVFSFNNIINNKLSLFLVTSSGFIFVSNNIKSDSDILIQTSFSFSRYCKFNYWDSGKWPRRKCQPIFAPILFIPWFLKPVDIPQCWPD